MSTFYILRFSHRFILVDHPSDTNDQKHLGTKVILVVILHYSPRVSDAGLVFW